jgi:signal transduction protein with GAF and PtsI domain
MSESTSFSPASAPPAAARTRDEQLEQLRFLHGVARLATTARTWEQLLEIVVDGTRDALRADVSSLYLLDRDGVNLTLAATNGLDRYQIGRARVPFGKGVTGRVAASREPLVIEDVRRDPRFLWVRGLDQKRFVASMLSVPLMWNEKTVGVLNVQTEQPRAFDPDDAAFLGAVADLMAGIVEKGRLQREAEAQVETLRRIDEARSELIALVTHELRTPLAVVRAYTELTLRRLGCAVGQRRRTYRQIKTCTAARRSKYAETRDRGRFFYWGRTRDDTPREFGRPARSCN